MAHSQCYLSSISDESGYKISMFWSFLILFFCEIPSIYLKNINSCTKNPKSNKITIKSLDHLATTTGTSASRRRAAILTPPSPEPGKACCSRACCSRQMGSHRAKAPKDQHTRAATIANHDNCRSEENDLKPHQQTQKPTGSREIRRAHNSTRPPPARVAPSERG
jgi:hypothetical protein